MMSGAAALAAATIETMMTADVVTTPLMIVGEEKERPMAALQADAAVVVTI